MRPRRLELDYIAAPRGPRALGFAVLAIALATAGVLVERYREVKFELERIETGHGLPGAERRAVRAPPRERL